MPVQALASVTPTQQIDYARCPVSSKHPFRKAVEEHDEAGIAALLADNVVFTSPVAFKPYVGKPITAAILRGVLRVFEDSCCLMSICPRRYSLPHVPDARDNWFVASLAGARMGGALRVGPALVMARVSSSVIRACIWRCWAAGLMSR